MDICEPCRDEGRGAVVAHYHEVPRHQSRTGARVPAMCWHHKWNRPRPNLSDPHAVPGDEDEQEISPGPAIPIQKTEVRKAMCQKREGCVRPDGHRGIHVGENMKDTNETPAKIAPRGSPTPPNGGGVRLDADAVAALETVIDKWWGDLAPVSKVKIFASNHGA